VDVFATRDGSKLTVSDWEESLLVKK